MVMVEAKSSSVWKYTDDIVAIILVIAWIICYVIGNALPEWLITAILGYVFGKNLPIQH